MSTRWWLLALPLLAAASILALLLGGEDDESVAGVPAVAAPRTDGRALPEAPAAAPAEVVGLQPDAGTGAPDAPDASDERFAWSPRDDVDHGRITGRLVDPGGLPVPREKVLLVLERDELARSEGRQGEHGDLLALAFADDDGRFALPALAGRRHTLLAGGTRWPVASVEGVAAGEDLLVSLVAGHVVEGTVIEEHTGLPVPAAHVLVLGGGTEILGAADGDGRFALGPAPAEDVAVAAYAEGFDVVLQAVAPALGPVTLELPPSRPLAGRLVERQTGAPAGPGRVRWTIDVEQQDLAAATAGGPRVLESAAAWASLVIEEREVEVDADGRFDLGPGPSVGFLIEAEAEGFVPERYDRHDSRPLGEEQEIVVPMTRATAWTGHATVAASGAPAAGAAVEASGPAGPFARCEVAADGSFELPMADWDGERPVRVTATDAAGRMATVRVRRDEQPLDLRLVDPLALTVLVTDGETPVPRAEVAVEGGEAEPTLGATVADGTATLSHPLDPDLGGVIVRARHGARQSLPVLVELPRADPAAPVAVDLAAGLAVEGVVADSYGAPIAGAEVAVQGGPFGHSGADGTFRLSPLPPDVPQRLDARADGFHRRAVAFIAGDPPLHVVLDPVLVFRGRAVDLATGAPLESTVIVLQSETLTRGVPTFQRVGRARVDRPVPGTGEFTVELPEPGRYAVQVASRDHVTTTSLPFEFSGATEPPFQEIALPRAARLQVTLLDGRVRPVEGLRVTAHGLLPDGKVDRDDRQSARTDGQGVAALNLGDGGVYRIDAGPAGLLAESVAVPAGVTVHRTFRTPPSGEIEVTAVAADGTPATDARVQVRAVPSDNAWNVSRRSRLRAPASSVVVDRLPPGEYVVVVTRRGSPPGSARVTVVPDRLLPVTVTLPDPGEGGDGPRRGLSRDQRAALQRLGYLDGGRGGRNR